MAAEPPRSTGTVVGGGGSSGGGGGGGAADSYIGSLISLTSKSEIRYEGVLFNIDTDEASIGLRNVRSFGTEGRRKDGPQVPAIDKVYEYIVFRGSDIKDLQVKSSPPAPVAPSVHNDPAIIQSHYTPPSAPPSLPSPATATQTGSSSDLNTQLPQPGFPRPTYQNNTPLYQPGGNMASWNPSPPLTANNSSLSAPMYWPGYYAPSAQPQQSLLRPVQGLTMPPSLQSPFQQQQVVYPNMNPPFPTGAPNMSALQSAGLPPSLLQPIASSTASISSTGTPVQSSLTVDSSSMMPSKAPPQAVPVVSQTTNVSLGSSALSNMLNKSTAPSLVSNQTKPISSSPMPFNSLSETPSSSSPALVTPGQFLQPGSTISTTSQMAQKDVEVVQVSSLDTPSQPPAEIPVTSASAPAPISAENQAPLLPLPTPVNQKMNGVSSHTRYVNRGGHGRGRGRGNEFSRSVPKYTEDFDFEAMNEKFKKDEVWGHLGKSVSKDDDGLDVEDEEDIDVPAADKKPVYKKDDFFDTLSCNALDRNGRTRFSEQMKLDTETFGDISRNRGYRGGRGPGYGGRSRGGYQGRGYGYGYGGRGRGPNVYRAI
ncbi:hypothetical protein vseg_002361 [Gypsophila vaccaria]